MQPVNGSKTKFKMNPKYDHKRSEGVTRRKNSGSKYVIAQMVNEVNDARS
jgi:hypothetical protein